MSAEDLARNFVAAARASETAKQPRHALVRLGQALACRPDDPDSHYFRGRMFRAIGRARSALDCCDKATLLNPGLAEAHLARGNMLRTLDHMDEALTAYEAALAANSGYVNARTNRATILGEIGRLEESVAEFRDVLQRRPDHASAHSNMLITILFMSSFTPAEIFREHRQFGIQHAARLAHGRQPHTNDPSPERRLRIGYLSSELRDHAMALGLLPVLQHHRRDRVSVHVFAHVPQPDAVTERMRGFVEEWVDIHALSDEAAAARIRASGIDVLVHPMGHWAQSRILILARKPAPIQINYHCNSPTTGIDGVDYALVDPWLDHDGSLATMMTETPVQLPSGFQIHSFDAAPALTTPPSQRADLTRGQVTFGSTNNPAKLSPATLQLWAATLRAVPGARLLIQGRGLDQAAVAAPLLARMREAGLPADRVAMRGRVRGTGAYLESYADFDIMLDTTPFSGGRTTLDALWMGVPVVTLVGDAVYGRFSFSHLMRARLPELCAFTAEEFARIAADLAASPERLAGYRATLRDRIKASSLIDAPTHVAELEAAYRDMWRRWCATRTAQVT